MNMYQTYVYHPPFFKNESIKSVYVKPNGNKASAIYIWKNQGKNYLKTVKMILLSYFMDEKLVFKAQDKMVATFSVDVTESAISMIKARNKENAKKEKKEKARLAQQERARILQLLEEIRKPKSEKDIHEEKTIKEK